MDKSQFFSITLASVAGGVLKFLRAGKLSLRRLAVELLGAIIIGFMVHGLLKKYTIFEDDLILPCVSVSAIIWTHLLDMVKTYIDKYKFV